MSTTQTQIVMSQHVNGSQRLFGGQLMSWIDVTGAVEARRHCRNSVTTITVDHLIFLAPAFLDDIIVLKADVTWTGKTSIEVRVDTYVEPHGGARQLVNQAYLVFVAIDDRQQPVAVAPFIPKTPEQEAEHAAAIVRREQRLNRRTPG